MIEDSIHRLVFLAKINIQDDISSELAGWEIQKLLEKQTKLENQYAELVAKRQTLTGITNREDLAETQEKIREVAQNLKDSTKKLCRLFKENPDIEKDAHKVRNERAELMLLLENLIMQVQQGQLMKFQQETTKKLEEQDQLRKLMADEKELTNKIKQLTREQTLEYNEYRQEMEEKNKKIQMQKEQLLKKRNKAAIKKQYEEKEHKAEIDTKNRLNLQEQRQLHNRIKELAQKIATETLVHNELKSYLTKKDEQTKAEADAWSHNVNNLNKKKIRRERWGRNYE